MKKKRKNILLIAGMLLALLVGILVYTDYTQEQIYQESTENLLSTYGQSAKTFTMFAQRNWNILTDWDSYLGHPCGAGRAGGTVAGVYRPKGYMAVHGFLPVQRAVRVLDHRRAAGHGRAYEGGF